MPGYERLRSINDETKLKLNSETYMYRIHNMFLTINIIP